MPVVALSSHNLHREPSASIGHAGISSYDYPSSDGDPLLNPVAQGNATASGSRSAQPQSMPSFQTGDQVQADLTRRFPVQIDNNELGIAFQPPTPISLSSEFPQDAKAGPSRESSTGPRTIPPPPNPRRHKSGVLMSRMRATSGGHPTSGDGLTMSMGLSKSYGDLRLAENVSGSTQVATPEEEKTEGEALGVGTSRRDWKRAVSENIDLHDEDSTMWDNSARFYHHIHSRPASRAGSRATSPARSINSTDSPSSSTHSPIYLRRSVNLTPIGGDHMPPHQHHPPMSGALSPNQSFLQQHLPPTFPLVPEPAHSNLLAAPDTNTRPHSMVILTPTTQEWRELKQLSRLEQGEDGEIKLEDSSDSGEHSRRASLAQEGDLKLRRSLSADFLAEEKNHQRDPGASPEKVSVPAPLSPKTPKSPQSPTLSKGQAQARRSISAHPSMDDVDPDKPIMMNEDDSPVRFNSIGKRPSLAVIRGVERPVVGRSKTKREREREKLFKDLDDELEADKMSDGDSRTESRWNGGVQEIGLGGGLGSRPSSSSSLSDSQGTGSPYSREGPSRVKSPTPVHTHPGAGHISPTQPIKPSPLHAHPLTADMNRESSSSGEEASDPNLLLDTPPLAGPRAAGPSVNPQSPSPNSQAHNLETIRDYARALVSPRPRYPAVAEAAAEASGRSTPSPPTSPRMGRRRDWANRVSLVAGRVVRPFDGPISTSTSNSSHAPAQQPNLQSFSPFHTPSFGPSKPTPTSLIPPSFNRLDSSISIAPSTGAPSECSTPTSETAGGIGGRGIDDYVILKEAGKGAYGLVMRAKVKGPKGEPVGDEVIIKYIIKARILADCWKKHKSLGPIPVEIHVMDQLRHLLYNSPVRPHPWDPMRARPTAKAKHDAGADAAAGSAASHDGPALVPRDDGRPATPDSPRSDSSFGLFSPAQKHIASEIRHSPERGHPNIAKLLDFFEDREFYYLVMPRFGTGLDLFDRVESCPDGLDPFEVRSLIGQLADAIRFLHSNGIVHRDIKDENVILDGSGRCQLIDFGSAAHWRPGKRWDTFSGTLHYASPEILRGEMYGGKEQDVWALGVVGYVLLVGETPFSELPDEVLVGLTPESRAEDALRARCENGHEEEGMEADGGGRLGDAADLVRQCLAMMPGERPSAEVICQHRYLRGEGGWVGKKGWVPMGWK